MKRFLIKSQGLNRLAIVIASIYTIIPLFFGNHDFSIGTFTIHGRFYYERYWHSVSYDYSVLIFGAIINFTVGYLLFKIYEWIKEGFKNK
tara:strand:- start:240 stop:509 length:270 start_codon:yes stop_codon:yes gene_type:complete